MVMLLPRLRAALAGALLLAALVPAAATAAEPGITPLGYTTGKMVDETPAIDAALKAAPDGHKWVRLFADWSQTERLGDGQYDNGFLGGMDARIRSLRGIGVRIIVTVQTPPAWAPSMNEAAGAQKYAEFMAHMAARYKGLVDVWELWNEPDDHIFWPDGPKADRYAAMLK